MTLNILGLKLVTLIVLTFCGAALWEYAFALREGEKWRNVFINAGISFAIIGTILLFFFV